MKKRNLIVLILAIVSLLCFACKKPQENTVTTFDVVVYEDRIEHGTVTAPATVEQGKSLTVTIAPDEGYETVNLRYTHNGETVTVPGAELASGTYVIENVQSSIGIVATFESAATHEHTYSDTWTKNEVQHWHAATCTHTTLKKDAADHEFGDDDVCDVCSYDRSEPDNGGNPGGDPTDPQTYTVTKSTVTGGTISAASSVVEGGTLGVTLTPNENYTIVSLTYTMGGQTYTIPAADLTDGNKYNIINVTSNVTVSAQFTTTGGSETPSMWSISISQVTGGRVSASPTWGEVNAEAATTLTVTPANGYEFVKLTYTMNERETEVLPRHLTNNQYTIRYISSNITVVPEFRQINTAQACQLTVTFGLGGTVTFNDEPVYNQDVKTYNAGDVVNIKSVANNGYVFNGIEITPEGGEAETVNSTDYDYTVEANATINVRFIREDTSVQINLPTDLVGGAITTRGNVTSVEKGGSVAVLVAPETNYELVSLMVNGVEKVGDVIANKLDLTTITETVNITARFDYARMNVNLSATPSSYGTPTLTSVVRYGDDAIINFNASNGYEAYKITVDGMYYEFENDVTSWTIYEVRQEVNVVVSYRVHKTTAAVYGDASIYGSSAVPAGTTLKLFEGANEVTSTTVQSDGSYTMSAPCGKNKNYVVKVDSASYYNTEYPVTLTYDDVQQDVVVGIANYEMSSSAIFGGYDADGEYISATDKGMAYKKDFIAVNGIASATLDITSGKAGAVVKCASTELVMLIGDGEFNVYSNGSLQSAYTREYEVSGVVDIAVYKYGAYVYFEVKKGNDIQVFPVQASGFENKACTFGVAAWTGAQAKFTNLGAYMNSVVLQNYVNRTVRVSVGTGGSVQTSGIDSQGIATIYDGVTIKVTPDANHSHVVTLNGVEQTHTSQSGNQYTYKITPSPAANVNNIVVRFIPSSSGFTVSTGLQTVNRTDTDGLATTTPYDNSIFYRNDLDTQGADPGVIYVTVAEAEDSYDKILASTLRDKCSVKNCTHANCNAYKTFVRNNGTKEAYAKEHGDYFYMVVTGGDGNGAFSIKKSRDLSKWDRSGTALVMNNKTWVYSTCWAPELIRDPESGKFFIYFSAKSQIGKAGDAYVSTPDPATETTDRSSGVWDRFYMGIGIADTPFGPYKIVTAENYYGKGATTNLNGEEITELTPPCNFGAQSRFTTELKNIGAYDSVTGLCKFPVIDIHPFFASNGDFYVFFSEHVSTFNSQNRIYGMKMKDMITPDYSTVTLLAVPSRDNITGTKGTLRSWNNGESSINDGTINEGVFVLEGPNGYFYLTYSPYGYGSRSYAVTQAVSVSKDPLSAYQKLDRDSVNPVLGLDVASSGTSAYQKNGGQYDFMSGTGHHSFVKAGDELFCVYHAFLNPISNYQNVQEKDDEGNLTGGIKTDQFMGRNVGFDRVFWVQSSVANAQGYVLQGNGPTHSLQPLPAVASGYENIASEASITYDVNSGHGNTQYLTDGRFTYHSFFSTHEYYSDNASQGITFSYSTPRTVRAVMVYSAFQRYHVLKKVDFTFTLEDNTVVGPFTQELDAAYYTSSTMRPGSSIIADFEAMKVKKIKVSWSGSYKLDTSQHANKVRIGDIVILGTPTNANARLSEEAAKRTSITYGRSIGGNVESKYVLDGNITSTELPSGRTPYNVTTGGATFALNAVVSADGVYLTAKSTTGMISYNGKYRAVHNTRLRFYVYGNSGINTAEVDAYNHYYWNSKLVAVGQANGTINSSSSGMSAEAYISWEDLGYAGQQDSVRFMIEYFKIESTSASVFGSWQDLPGGISVKSPSTWPTFTESGYTESNNFGDSYDGAHAATGGVTVNNGTNEVETTDGGRREIWLRSTSADNFNFSLNAAYGLTADTTKELGVIVSVGGVKYDFPLPDCSVNGMIYSVIKGGDTIVVSDSTKVLYAISDPAFRGEGNVGVYATTPTRFSAMEFTPCKSKAEAFAGSYINTDGNYLAEGLADRGTVYIPEPIKQSGTTTKAYVWANSGYEVASVSVDGTAKTLSTALTNGVDVPMRNSAGKVVATFSAIANKYTYNGTVTASGLPVQLANVTVVASDGNTYKTLTDAEGKFSLELNKNKTYKVDVSLNGYSGYGATLSTTTNSTVNATINIYKLSIGGNLTVNGSVVNSGSNFSQVRPDVYRFTWNTVGFISNAVGGDAVIKFTMMSRLDPSVTTTYEGDNAMGIYFTDGTKNYLMAAWQTGVRVRLDSTLGWTDGVKSINNLGMPTFQASNGACGNTVSYMMIREGSEIRFFWWNPEVRDYVKVYDSGESGHTFACGTSQVAFGFGNTADGKAIDVEVSNLSMYLDANAANLIAQYQ